MPLLYQLNQAYAMDVCNIQPVQQQKEERAKRLI